MTGLHKIKQMKQFLYTITCSLVVLLGSCEWKSEEALFAEPEACAEPLSFATHIAPIVQTNCAISGCHLSGGQPPELTSYEKVKARATDVLRETQSGNMPPSYSNKSLTQEEVKQIACWVEQGMPRE